MTFWKPSLIWKVVEILHIHSQDWMLILAYSYASVVFFYIIACCKISNLIVIDTHYTVWRQWLCYLCIEWIWISWPGRELQKFYQRSYIVNLSDLWNAMSKMLDQISFHKHFKIYRPLNFDLWRFMTSLLTCKFPDNLQNSSLQSS